MDLKSDRDKENNLIHCIPDTLNTVYLVYRIHCTQYTGYIICIYLLYRIHCTLYTWYTRYIVYSILGIPDTLYIVYLVYRIHCIQYTWYTVHTYYRSNMFKQLKLFRNLQAGILVEFTIGIITAMAPNPCCTRPRRLILTGSRT